MSTAWITFCNYKDSQRNMVVSLFIQVLLIGLFLVLGTLLYLYVERYPEYGINANGDSLFCAVAWSKEFPLYIGVIFILGLISSSYSASASALTSLTTSFTVDILRADEKQSEKDLTVTRKLVHIMMSLIMIVIIMIFYEVKSDSSINAVFSLASYTYGPIVGMFIFGLACRKKVKDRWVPLVAVFSPLLSYWLKVNSEEWFGGYQISFELLIINALITVVGLTLLIERRKVSSVR